MEMKQLAKQCYKDGKSSFLTDKNSSMMKREELQKINTQEIIKEVLKLLMKDHHYPERVIFGALGINTVKTVLINDLKFHKICIKFMLKIHWRCEKAYTETLEI